MIKQASDDQLVACEDKIKDLESQLNTAISRIKELERLLPELAVQKNKKLSDDEKVNQLKAQIASLENKIASSNDLLTINEQHRKGKIKTVDFLWRAWNLSQPKGRPPQDQGMTEEERVNSWL